jgi:MFS family permease
MRRLMPLYIGAFLQGFVLWYAVEKLFMTDIGFNDATIGVMVAAYAIVMLLFETPSGILADRWSRKGVLIMASVALLISNIVCGFSHSVEAYIVGILFWGIFYALYSGTYDSVVYDTLLEEKGSAKLFEKYYGRVRFVESIAWVVGALLGGLVADLLNLRATFFLTIPITILSIGALMAFREPVLHKSTEVRTLKDQVKETWRAVSGAGLRATLTVLVGISLISEIIFEFNQLWLIALAAPLLWYGPANALLYSAQAFGALLAPRLRLQRKLVLLVVLGLLLAAAVALVFLQTITMIVAAQIIIALLLLSLDVIFRGYLHDALPSEVRAGSASAVNTLALLLFIPISLLFGAISARYDVFAASWLVVGLILLWAPVVIRIIRKKKAVAYGGKVSSRAA